MELKRVLGRDARTAAENAIARFGKDVFVISTSRVGSQVELIVALEDSTAAPQAIAADVPPAPAQTAGDAFSDVLSAARFASRSITLASPQAKVASRAPSEPANDDGLPAAFRKRVLPASHAATAPIPSPAVVPQADLVGVIRDELAELRREFRDAQQRTGLRSAGRTLAQHQLWEALADAGVPEELRARAIEAMAPGDTAEQGARVLADLLKTSLRAIPTAEATSGVHALCGPSGAGKTLAAVRLARAAAERSPGARSAVVSFADQRPGGWARLQVLGAAAGVETFRARDLDALRAVLDDFGDAGLVVLDTAAPDAASLARELDGFPHPVTRHVVLPADASQVAINQLTRRGTPGGSSVLLTKLDESTGAWPLIRAFCSHPIPVVGVAASDRVGDPLRRIDGDELVERAMEAVQQALDADNDDWNMQSVPFTLNSTERHSMSGTHGY
jgi:flagellar biosynthesis protein FlhF